MSDGFVSPFLTPDDLTIQSAPQQRWQLVRTFLPRPLQPYLRGLRKRYLRLKARGLVEPFRTAYPYTQVNHTRQRNLVRLGALIDRENIPGDCVECGVLDGGTAALIADATKSTARRVHLFDAWQGLPDSTAEDGADAHRWHGQVVGSPRRVAHVMSKFHIEPQRIVIHRGWFQDTFPVADVDQVALVHVDADFYEATRLCLSHWYPRLSPGGFMQFDDYASFRGCRQAVNEFLSDHPELKLEVFGELEAKAFFIQKPRL